MVIGSISTFTRSTVEVIDQAFKGQPKRKAERSVTQRHIPQPRLVPMSKVWKMARQREAFLNALGKKRFRSGKYLSFCTNSLDHHDARVRESAAWAIARLWKFPFPKGFDVYKQIDIRVMALDKLWQRYRLASVRNEEPYNYRAQRARQIVSDWIRKKITISDIQNWLKHPLLKIRTRIAGIALLLFDPYHVRKLRRLKNQIHHAMRIATGEDGRGNSEVHRALRFHSLTFINRTSIKADSILEIHKDRISKLNYIFRKTPYSHTKFRAMRLLVNVLADKRDIMETILCQAKTSLRDKDPKVRIDAISRVIVIAGPKKAMSIFQKHLSEEDQLLADTAMLVIGGLALVSSLFPEKSK